MKLLPNRRIAGVLIFAVGLVVCGLWARNKVAAVEATGSGGIGAVSVGLAELIIELAMLVVPFIATFRLAKAAGSGRLAKTWRNAHVVTVLALLAVGIAAPSISRSLLVLALFVPVQLFFVIGAFAIWIARVNNSHSKS